MKDGLTELGKILTSQLTASQQQLMDFIASDDSQNRQRKEFLQFCCIQRAKHTLNHRYSFILYLEVSIFSRP